MLNRAMKYKKIPLTQGKFALVDAEDYGYLNQFKWYAHKFRNTFYAVRHIWKNGKQTTLSMHREIMQTPEGMETDHRNGDGLDNRRRNLRICTCSQNHMNGKKQKSNTSGYKGVYWNTNVKKWMGYIQVNGKQKYLGYYLDKEEAAEAYNKAAKEYFGEFAKLNIIK